MHPDLVRYAKACNYPGPLDGAAVDRHLADYLEALGVERRITRLHQGWTLEEHPELVKYANEVLEELVPARVAFTESGLIASVCYGEDYSDQEFNDALTHAHTGPIGRIEDVHLWHACATLERRHASEALGALYDWATFDPFEANDDPLDPESRDLLVIHDILTAHSELTSRSVLADRDALLLVGRDSGGDRDALRRLTAWCIQGFGWGRRFDLSSGAKSWFRVTSEADKACRRPLFEAFLAGAWILHWTRETLFWVAKPRLHIEGRSSTSRFHRSDGPALESEVEDLYFWHGVLVPDFVVMRPEEISLDQIHAERNVEVRRILIERYGHSRYLHDSKAEVLHHDEFGTLYFAPTEGDEPLVMVRVVNPTPGADGSYNEYFLRVPPTMKRARQAVAWTFGLAETEYNPRVQT